MSNNKNFGPTIITGGSGALGSAIARQFLTVGAPVVLVARGTERLRKQAAQLAEFGRVHTIAADVTDHADRERIVAETLDVFGSIQTLVNNAGAEHIGRLDQHRLADVEHMVQMNLVAPIELTRLATPALTASGGHVINIVTMAAKTPMTPMSVYAATKSALGKFTDLVALELIADGVAATAIYPGAIAGDGMFATMQQETGVDFPKRMPLSSPDWVAAKVVTAVRKRPREVFAAPGGAAMARHPRLAGRVLKSMGVADAFARVADVRAHDRANNGTTAIAAN